MAPLEFYVASDKERGQLAAFFNRYRIESEVVCPKKKKTLLPKHQRICKFCGAKGLDKWKKEAHTFPHFLGNNTLFSDDECSECNEKFSHLETHLAAFLGFSRTINQVKGKRGVPKFKSADQKVVIIGDEVWQGASNVHIERILDGNSNFKFDPENGSGEILVSKETYIPILAYKALIKIAYSILPKSALPFYPSTLAFIVHDTLDEAWADTCRVNRIAYQLGTGTRSPFVLLCKKRDVSLNVPMYCVLFFWQNLFFQISIPYHESDIENFGGKPLRDILLPPFLFFEAKNITASQQIVNLGSKIEKKGEKEILKLKYDPSIPMVGYDSATQQEIDLKFNADTIIGIRLVKEKDFRLPIKKPSQERKD